MSRCDFAGLNNATSGLRYLRNAGKTFAWDDAITVTSNRTFLLAFLFYGMSRHLGKWNRCYCRVSRFRIIYDKRHVKSLARQRRSARRKNILVKIARECVKDRLYGPLCAASGVTGVIRSYSSWIHSSARAWHFDQIIILYYGIKDLMA